MSADADTGASDGTTDGAAHAEATTNVGWVMRLAARVTSESARTWTRRAAMAASAIVPLWMLVTILGDDPFHRLDYLQMLGQIYDGDGSLRWRGFIEHQNEHLVLVPKLVIVANVLLFDGSRVTLGLFVWCVAAALAAVIAVALRPTLRLTEWGRVIAVWALVLFTFPIVAQHNFRIAISGTAWTLANLLMIVAVVLAVRGHSLRAGAVGAAATFTYGTGLAVWPALVVVLAVRRRCTRRDLVMLAMGVAAVAFERLTPVVGTPRPPVNRWIPTIARNASAMIGELFVDGAGLASVVGLVLIAVAVVAVAVRLRLRRADEMSAVAVACLTVPAVSILLVSLGRSLLDTESFGSSRYMGVSALFTLFAVSLALLAFGDTLVLRVSVAALAALSLFGSRFVTDDIDAADLRIQRDAAAVYMGVGDRIVVFHEMVASVLPALGHVPFDGSFDADCGLWGEQIDPGGVSGQVRGSASPLALSTNDRARTISGWIDADDVDCVVIIDADGTVVGIAVPGYDRDAGVPVDISPFIRPVFKGFVLAEHAAPLTVVARLDGTDTFVSVAEVPEGRRAGDAGGGS